METVGHCTWLLYANIYHSNTVWHLNIINQKWTWILEVVMYFNKSWDDLIFFSQAWVVQQGSEHTADPPDAYN